MPYPTSEARDVCINITVPVYPEPVTDGEGRACPPSTTLFAAAAAASAQARAALEASDRLLAALQDASRNALLTDAGAEALCELERFHRALKLQVDGQK